MYYKMRKNGSLWGRFLVGGGTRKSGRRVGAVPEKKEKSDRIIKIQNCMYFSKNKKIRKKVLTFAGGSVIITKLSARADANEFL